MFCAQWIRRSGDNTKSDLHSWYHDPRNLSENDSWIKAGNTGAGADSPLFKDSTEKGAIRKALDWQEMTGFRA